MPTYDYCCNKCGNIFEELRNISDRKKPIKCPKCDSHARLQFGGGPHLELKGQGFHKNDYPSK